MAASRLTYGSNPAGNRAGLNARSAAPSGPAIISTQALTRVFGSGEQAVTAVNGVDLDIYPGEFLAVMGRSGSGKTTMLNLLAGLDRPTSGAVTIEGRNLAGFSESQLVELRRTRISSYSSPLD